MPSKLSPQLCFFLLFASVLTACQNTGNRSSTALLSSPLEPLPTSCAIAIDAFRSSIDQAGLADASAPVSPFNPLLHSDRFLHGLAHSAHTATETREWMSLLAELAIRTRASENTNLRSPMSSRTLEELAKCSRDFATAAEYAEARAALLVATRQSDFPAHYIKSRQVLGAVAVLRPFLRQRILALHAEERRWFLEEESYPRSIFYEADATRNALATHDVAQWMRTAYERNELALPLLSETQLDSLFAEHAPSLQIEYQADNDKIGDPLWEGEQIRIDTESPVAYVLPSMTRFEGRNLLQLNYVFWFAERKARALIDLYSGRVDSIIWRVTLDEEGQVLLYDSIHSCGCYHKYFVASDSLATKLRPDSKEPANIFRLDSASVQNGPTLTVTANEHYIVGLDARAENRQADSLPYDLRPYQQLYSLQSDDGRRSLFDDRGLIAGSERLERFTLWPTGILSVGAMRQWGTHATGFIEEQQFDDADLLEKYFESQP